MDLSNIKRTDIKVVPDDLAEILAATIADYETRSGKVLQPAHIERLIINTYAYREMLMRQAMNEAYRQQHPRYATGLMLDLCGDDVNTPRLEATAARCIIRVQAVLSGSETLIIPVGTRVAVGDTVFATLSEGILTAAVPLIDLTAQCQRIGTVGNGWSVGQINTLLDSFAVEVKAANTTVPGGGIDSESDDAYRERILLAPESFSVAGPVGAYQYWARQVSPVICDVHVGNAIDGNNAAIGGTVAVTVLTKSGLPADTLLAQVRQALSDERKRPLCDTVVVKAPTAIDYVLRAELVLFAGANALEVQTAAQQAWTSYEAARRERLGLDIVPLDIQTALKVAGVYNVILHNLPLTVVKPDQWARCTAVNISIATERADG